MPADRRALADISVSRKPRKPEEANTRVVGVEGTVVWSGRPDDETVERLRAALLAEGYTVALREQRECTEAACTITVGVDWNRPTYVPAGWFGSVICGRHNYRSCLKCGSIFRFTSTTSSGPAPSVHCEVCGAVAIEWGGSKIWNAELVTRGRVS